MTGTSASSDKSGKKNKGFTLASSSKGNSCMKLEYEILKENHETLKIDCLSLQERLKLAEETYEVMKKLLQSKNEVTNARLEEMRSERDKYKKMFEEMKTVESDRKAKIDELRKREEELLMATRIGKEDAAKLENKFVALAERFGVIEADCSYLKALYDAEVADKGLDGETVNLIVHEVNSDATDPIVIYDERRSQQDQCKNQEIFTPRAVTNHSTPFSASPASSSSSSSSDGYHVVFKRPANWPEWAMPKGPADDSNKS